MATTKLDRERAAVRAQYAQMIAAGDLDPTKPQTSPPTEAEHQNYLRWGGCGGPLATRRQRWISREAMARHMIRTGWFTPWPDREDYETADRIIPAEVPA